MRIFHIATLADWKQAQESGSYTTSTYGRTLEEEGFIHAAYHDQVPTVRDRFYADVSEPLVVLEIETDLLDVPWREDQVDGESFPHVYGPLDPSAVVAWRPARFLPIEIAARPQRPPLTPLVAAFLGLAVTLGAATLAALVAAGIAQARVDRPGMSTGVAFLLWSAAGIGAVAAAAALGFAAWAWQATAPGAQDGRA